MDSLSFGRLHEQLLCSNGWRASETGKVAVAVTSLEMEPCMHACDCLLATCTVHLVVPIPIPFCDHCQKSKACVRAASHACVSLQPWFSFVSQNFLILTKYIQNVSLFLNKAIYRVIVKCLGLLRFTFFS